ncbi:hypothetical protein QTP70_002817, partial [Hemibagrus guttatus]
FLEDESASLMFSHSDPPTQDTQKIDGTSHFLLELSYRLYQLLHLLDYFTCLVQVAVFLTDVVFSLGNLGHVSVTQIEKPSLLGLNTSLCNWILDFLTVRPQLVRIRNSISSTTTLLYTLLTHDCAAMHSSNHIINFADQTTVVGLISKNDESAYREEVQRLTAWCKANNLSLNVDKTKKMVVDFRRAQSGHSLPFFDGSLVEIVKMNKFLGVHLSENLT